MTPRLASRLKLGALVAGVVIVWALWGLYGIRAFAGLMDAHKESFGAFGQLGDLFGAINALFAALAFLGVAVAAYYQQKTWHLQVELQRQQAFEPLFFALLDRLHRPDSLAFDATPMPYANAVSRLRRLLDDIARAAGLAELRAVHPVLDGRVISAYEKFYGANESALGTYFRSLYHVFKQVHTSGMPERDRVKYANIVRAALSIDDLLVLALDARTEAGRNLRALVEEYGLLKHRRVDPAAWTLDQGIPTQLFSPTATMSHVERLAYWREHPEERARLSSELALI